MTPANANGVLMPCADEDLQEREFVPTDEGDFVCCRCGFNQASPAAGAAELCLYALWHSLEAYSRYAEIAREGGFTVPDAPPRFAP